nr:zinc finger, CCHC-type [Tanacetum cinerariifolium]
QEEGQSVSLCVLNMKGYIDNLERLGHPVTLSLGVSLILIGLRKEYDGFVQNYNMHSMGKTVNELQAMLKLHEQTLPKSNALNAIRAGKVQKSNKHKKSHSQKGAKGQNQGKGKFVPKPKIPPPPKRENPVKDSIYHECEEIGHWKRNCPQYQAELMKKKKNTASGAGGSGSMASRKLKPGALRLYVGNGQREAIEAIGAFYLCLPSGLEIFLNNCHYAPSITRGVISVSRLSMMIALNAKNKLKIVTSKMIEHAVESEERAWKNNGDREQRKRLIRFRMGLAECYSNLRGQILLLQPLPSVAKAYGMIRQEEKQRECVLPKPLESVAFSTQSYQQTRFNNSNKNANKQYPNRPQTGRKSTYKPEVYCTNCSKEGQSIDECYKLKGCLIGHSLYGKYKPPVTRSVNVNDNRNPKVNLVHMHDTAIECYSNLRGQILLLQPLPSVAKAYGMIRQEEKQRECVLPKPLESAAFSTQSYQQTRFNNSNRNANKQYPNRPQTGRKSTYKPEVYCTNCSKEGQSIDECYKLKGCLISHSLYGKYKPLVTRSVNVNDNRNPKVNLVHMHDTASTSTQVEASTSGNDAGLNKRIAHGNLCEGLYIIYPDQVTPTSSTVLITNSKDSTMLWHSRLGHPSTSTLQQIKSISVSCNEIL